MAYLISSIQAFPLLILPILISCLLIQTAFSDYNSDNHYLHHICLTSSRNYNDSSTYHTNLIDTLTGLQDNTPPNNGYYFESWGEQGPDQVNGLAFCRGDVSTNDCRACLVDASSNITTYCPYYRAALIWYDYCLLKYSDQYFFGQIDIENTHHISNNVSAENPKEFGRAAKGLLSNLSRNSTDTTTNYMFARGEKLFDDSKNLTVYGMAQCSEDLSKLNCTKCLHWAVKKLPRFTTKISRVGGRSLTGSCNVRYEIYPFLKN